jgi:hypothetical protein
MNAEVLMHPLLLLSLIVLSLCLWTLALIGLLSLLR